MHSQNSMVHGNGFRAALLFMPSRRLLVPVARGLAGRPPARQRLPQHLAHALQGRTGATLFPAEPNAVEAACACANHL